MPKSEQRIQLIGSAILEQARLESEEIRAAADEALRTALQSYRDEVIDKMYAKIQSSVYDIHRQSANLRAAAQKDSYRALLTRRVELAESVFQAVQKRLSDYASTGACREKLLEQLGALKDRYDHACSIVTLRPSDDCLAAEIHAILGLDCEIRYSAGIKLGGFMLENTAAGVLINHTLDQRLREEWPWFLENCGLKVM